MNFTSTSEIKARVYELYLTEDQEVNSNFFDFHVRNLRSTLLKTYAEIQKAINEDAVVLLKNSIETRHGSEIQVNGILSSWKEIGEIYAKIVMDFMTEIIRNFWKNTMVRKILRDYIG